MQEDRIDSLKYQVKLCLGIYISCSVPKLILVLIYGTLDGALDTEVQLTCTE
jgi:hypothetical protein